MSDAKWRRYKRTCRSWNSLSLEFCVNCIYSYVYQRTNLASGKDWRHSGKLPLVLAIVSIPQLRNIHTFLERVWTNPPSFKIFSASSEKLWEKMLLLSQFSNHSKANYCACDKLTKRKLQIYMNCIIRTLLPSKMLGLELQPTSGRCGPMGNKVKSVVKSWHRTSTRWAM